ncbi:MAG: primosomal protein N' [Candidatus Yanofskybacteria bacterium]|nr:primosomal protein N' [Candidatus Yanofskybacteria bacterium]
MFVIEVIPLAVLPPNVPQILSYFFDKKLERGAVVQVSIGNRSVKAIVTDSIPLAEHKMGLKKAEFQLKKLSEVLTETPQISNRQLHIALWLSKTYYSPLGMCLKAVLPPFFLKKKFPISREFKIKIEREVKRKPDFILTDAKNALKNILPLIKSEVSKDGQAVLIVPDNQTLDHFYKNLSKDFNTVKVFSKISNKVFFDDWQDVQSGKVQVVVGTRQALLFPFKKLALVIVDDPLHEFYKSDMSPKYNTANLAGYISEMNNCRLVYLSPITGVENYFFLKNKEYELTDKTSSPPPIKTINMVSEIKSGNFSLLSRELQNHILMSVDNRLAKSVIHKILIFSPRRGHSGILVCQNCGYTAKCNNCEVAYRIHRAEDLILMCHHCGNTQRLPDHCPNCNSPKLKPTGPAGSQKIYEEVRRVLSQNEVSGVPVLILDTDVTANQTEEEEVMSEIAKPKTSILIATQMIFSYRYDHDFDFIAIMNADSLIQSPDFHTEERLFYQLEKLFDFKPQQLLIQTFNPENQAIVMASQRNYKDFYEKELAIRQALSYPPFSRLIKLTFRHPNRDIALREARILAGKLKMAVKITDSSPGYTERERGLYTYNIVVKSLTGQTPREILKYVPSRWLIDVDPRTLL